VLYLIWHIATQGYEPTKLIPGHKLRYLRLPTYVSYVQGSVASETEQLQMANNPDLSPLWTSFNISQMPTS